MQLHSDWPVNLADDQPRTGMPMEWWFVQGFYEGAQSGRREFMAALFRYNYKLPQAETTSVDAFTLLLSVLDPATGRTTTLSQIDPATCEIFISAARSSPSSEFDPVILRAMVDEVSEYGPPRPIHIDSTPVELASAPFGVKWGSFELAHAEGVFALNFTEPESDRRCRLQLQPIHPRIHLENIAVIGDNTMDYLSYPRLALTGEVDGEVVRGQAWLDHQWGNHHLVIASTDRDHVLGWDWLGIQLDDGHDLLVMVLREQRQQQRLCQYAVLVNAAGTARLIRDFDLVPVSWWTSPVTHTRYPVACRLSVPELKLELDFTPSANNQEIQNLAPLRALWEGAGQVAGKWDGRAVNGHARLELHGYAYVFGLQEHLDSRVRRIRQHIESYLPRTITDATMVRFAGRAHGQYDPEAQTAVLATPLWDLLDRGGKNWRPIFVFLLLDALGVSPEPYELLFSLTVEMLHDGALIIDDIEDNALIRRGEKAIHLRYGLDVAINAGNTAYFLPLALLRDYPNLSDAQRLELFRIHARGAVGAHLGQGQDIYWSRNLTAERLREWMDDSLGSKIIQLYSQKTASITECGAEGTCVIAQVDDATRQVCADFGRAFGVAFQIVNDIVDFSPGRLAKGHGGCDLTEGKLTYVIFRALERLPEMERARLAEIFCSQNLRNEPAALAEGIGLVRGSGALEACRQEARAMVEEQWKRLSALVPPSESKTMLRVLARFILSLGEDERDIEFAPGN